MSYLKLKCTKFDMGWGSITPPNPLLDLRGLFLREGIGGRAREGRGPSSKVRGRGEERGEVAWWH